MQTSDLSWPNIYIGISLNGASIPQDYTRVSVHAVTKNMLHNPNNTHDTEDCYALKNLVKGAKSGKKAGIKGAHFFGSIPSTSISGHLKTLKINQNARNIHICLSLGFGISNAFSRFKNNTYRWFELFHKSFDFLP